MATTTKQTSVETSLSSKWKTERLKYKSPKERKEINDRLTTEQRMEVVDQRKLNKDASSLVKIEPKFSAESRTHSVVSDLALYFGSAVNASLDESGNVHLTKTDDEKFYRWRIHDFFTGREVNDVMVSICDAVLGTDDDELLRRVEKEIKSSSALSDRKKKNSHAFFEKLFGFRKANQARRNKEIRAEAMSKYQLMSPEEKEAFLRDLGITATGSIEMTNVSSRN